MGFDDWNMAGSIDRHLNPPTRPPAPPQPREVDAWCVHQSDGSCGQLPLYDYGDGRYTLRGGARHIKAGEGTGIAVYGTEADALRASRTRTHEVVTNLQKRLADTVLRLTALGEEDATP